MKHKKLFLGIVILIVTAVTLGLYTQVIAQQEVVEYLKERLEKQNISVVELTISRRLPLCLEVIIQSTSEDEKAMPDDPINLHTVRREVILARQQGYVIDSFTLILLNRQGKTLFWAETPVDIENVRLGISQSEMKDGETKNLIDERLDLHGMSVTDLEVSSSGGIQTLILQLSTSSLEEANQTLPHFMPSLRPLIEEVNVQGAQVVVCRIELVDEKGQVLLKYLLDLQTDSETWWMADGLTQEWFPHPPAE